MARLCRKDKGKSVENKSCVCGKRIFMARLCRKGKGKSLNNSGGVTGFAGEQSA